MTSSDGHASTGLPAMDTECSICLKLFRTPKLLPCRHVFCQPCLLHHLKTSRPPSCPVCRCAIEDPKAWDDRDEGWERVVEALPTDHVTEAVAESARELRYGASCVGCRHRLAATICVTCGDKFCRGCAAVHTNTTLSRHHRLEKLSSLTPEEFAAIRPVVCSAHRTAMPAEFFCSAHDVAICQRCAAATQHRACSEVTSCQERKEKVREEIQALSGRLKARKKKLEQDMAELDQRARDLQDQHHKTLEDIERDCQQLKEAARACQRRLQRQAKDDLVKAKDRQRRQDGLKAHRASLERLKRSIPSTFVSARKIKDTLKTKVDNLDLSVTLPADLQAKVKRTPQTLYKEVLEVVNKAMKGDNVRPAPKAVTAHIPSAGPSTQHSNLQFTKLGDSWRCSPFHGRNITLSNSRRTVDVLQNKEQPHSGIITTMHAMSENVIYAIRLNRTDSGTQRASRHLPCGVVVKTAGPLPDTARSGWAKALVLSDSLYDCGVKVNGSDLEGRLEGLPIGSEVGVMIDTFRRLHLFIYGRDVMTVTDVTIPYTSCYAFFEVDWGYTQVSTVPPKQLQENRQPTTLKTSLLQFKL